jgi:aminoglycoside phosphotransferase family enzyme
MSGSSPGAGVSADAGARVSIEAKVGFLSRPEAYGEAGGRVEVVETHMSYVFLTGARAYKIKKPVRYPFLDFSTLSAREADCRLELALNRRLAPGVYFGLSELRLAPDGSLALDGPGETVEWAVAMRRLPEARMLDRLLIAQALRPEDVDRLAEALARFYRQAERPAIAPRVYVERLVAEEAVNRRILTARPFAVDHGRAPAILDRLDEALRAYADRLEARVAEGRLVDGHGDLKPEHVCFEDEVAIFDCLEFSAELRMVDPVDELAYFGVECALLGAPWLGPALFERVTSALGDEPQAWLFHLHAARRAALRARLALAHLLDAAPRTPAKWEPLAARYLGLAEQALDRLDGR